MHGIKSRNQRFWFLSKSLIEIVNVFGMYGDKYGNPNGYEKGPYFCGLSRELSFPSYNIRLTGPCSTSKQLSVATRFADADGIILKVMNHDDTLHFFDCSWISCYKEEEERIFIAGNVPIKIVSIIIVDGGKQYLRWVRILSAFDDILTGAHNRDFYDHSLMSKSDIADLIKLLGFLRNEGDNSYINMDPYLKKLLLSYQLNKQQIVINLWYLWEYVSNSYLSQYESTAKNDLLSLCLYDEVKDYEYGFNMNAIVSDTDSSNIVKIGYLLSVFKFVKEIVIYTTDKHGKHAFKCNHGIFAKYILAIDYKVKIEIRATRYPSHRSWISKLYKFLKKSNNDDRKTITILKAQENSFGYYDDILYIDIV